MLDSLLFSYEYITRRVQHPFLPLVDFFFWSKYAPYGYFKGITDCVSLSLWGNDSESIGARVLREVGGRGGERVER